MHRRQHLTAQEWSDVAATLAVGHMALEKVFWAMNGHIRTEVMDTFHGKLGDVRRLKDKIELECGHQLGAKAAEAIFARYDLVVYQKAVSTP